MALRCELFVSTFVLIEFFVTIHAPRVVFVLFEEFLFLNVNFVLNTPCKQSSATR